MSGDDALAERLFQIGEWITLMKRAEGWRDFQRAFGEPVDRVATGTVGPGDGYAALRALETRQMRNSMPAQ